MFKLWCEWGIRLELTCLRFVRAFREAKFALYVDGIRQILTLLFAMDHTNYDRWLAVHNASSLL